MSIDTQRKHTNRLSRATSPYLLQHAHNPVDWNEWGAEALDQAKREDKPIFLSIGYAACHWCHVMEHESFEDEQVAGVLNRGFVSIKVDREERPDIDDIYMAYTQATTGHGGWPMSVWLTPDGTPFFAGTYFRKDQFVQLLERIEHLWTNERGQIEGHKETAKGFLAEWSAGSAPGEAVIPREAIERSAATLARHFDPQRGGLGSGGNKFPPSMAMELMLRVHRRTGDGDLLAAVEVTLDHMARGGIYDHVGGGICRYSTDPDWLVPHFEKMLYDQALVSGIYLDAYLLTRKPQYAAFAADIFDYVIADLRSPEGAFFSSRDADSGGFEGAYYIWTVDEIVTVLGKDEGELACKYYDVTEGGNWFEQFGHAPPGPKNVLHITKPLALFARVQGVDEADLSLRIAMWRSKLREVRAKRTPPGRDDKVLTAWNGLMIASLAKGARTLDQPKYAEAAASAATFLLAKMQTPDGRLLRTYRKGEARLTAYLEDYSFFVEGLLNLYEATFDIRWLNEASRLTDLSIRYYFDEQGGAFFFTATDAEKLVARSKSPSDGAIPSGNSVQAMNLLRLAILLDRKDLRAKAESIFRAVANDAVRSPGAFERMNCAVDFYHDRVKEIAVIGEANLARTRALLNVIFDRYMPNKVVVAAAAPVTETPIPLLRSRPLKNGLPTAYVCENYTCKSPVNTAEELATQLAER